MFLFTCIYSAQRSSPFNIFKHLSALSQFKTLPQLKSKITPTLFRHPQISYPAVRTHLFDSTHHIPSADSTYFRQNPHNSTRGSIMNCSADTVRRKADSGEIPSFYVGSHRRSSGTDTLVRLNSSYPSADSTYFRQNLNNSTRGSIMNYSADTVRRKADSGESPSFYVGSHRRFFRHLIDKSN